MDWTGLLDSLVPRLSAGGGGGGAWLGEGERKREPGIHCSRMHKKSPEFWGLAYSQ